MKYIVDYLREKVLVEPLGEVTTRENERYNLSGEDILINGKDVDIFVSHIDYCMWLEDKLETKK